MSWKIVSMALPEDDEDILMHLSSVPHSWTVDHVHTECHSELPVCHAASHEYGISADAEGIHQHQHFIEGV